MSVKIIFVGDVMQDILISFKDQIAYGSDTQSQIKMQGGGSATNTACWASTQNVSVGLVARIGDDQTGKLIRDGLIHQNLSSRDFVFLEPSFHQLYFSNIDSCEPNIYHA